MTNCVESYISNRSFIPLFAGTHGGQPQFVNSSASTVLGTPALVPVAIGITVLSFLTSYFVLIIVFPAVMIQIADTEKSMLINSTTTFENVAFLLIFHHLSAYPQTFIIKSEYILLIVNVHTSTYLSIGKNMTNSVYHTTKSNLFMDLAVLCSFFHRIT